MLSLFWRLKAVETDRKIERRSKFGSEDSFLSDMWGGKERRNKTSKEKVKKKKGGDNYGIKIK